MAKPVDVATQRVRVFSKSIFGGARRLEALVAVASLPRQFTADAFSRESGIPQSAAYQELARLRVAGLLTRSRDASDRAFLYERTSSIMWSAAVALDAEQRVMAVKDSRVARAQEREAVVGELAAMAVALRDQQAPDLGVSGDVVHNSDYDSERTVQRGTRA